MSYVEAFKIGWSILWREVAWAACVVVAVWAIYRTDRTLLVPAGTVALFALIFYFLPRTIRRLTGIQYNDFHLAVMRPEGGDNGWTYIEALVLSFAIHLVNGFLAGPLIWLLGESYQYFLVVFYPLFVAGPLAAFVLANFPTQRFQLEAVPNSWVRESREPI